MCCKYILKEILMSKSKIEWTGSTWNPITGCTKISDGCANCYAERMAKRLQAMKNPRYTNGFKLTIHEDVIEAPYKWKKSQLIFVNSMSDLFHEDVSDEIIQRIFTVMNKTPQHTYQVLTKRADRLEALSPKLNFSDNIWIGVTVESSKYIDRIDNLRTIEAKIRFLSLEPLLDDLGEINLENIDWVIVGGESGPKSREIKKEWIYNIKKQAEIFKTLFYFKQWGGVNKKKNGRLLDGLEYNDMPKIKIKD